MAIETFGNGGMCITGEHIEVFRLLSMQKTLKLEVKTGMKFSNRVNVAAAVRNLLESNGVKAPRNKAKLLEVFNSFLDKQGIIVGY